MSKDHLETRSGVRKVDGGSQLQLEQDGDNGKKKAGWTEVAYGPLRSTRHMKVTTMMNPFSAEVIVEMYILIK